MKFKSLWTNYKIYGIIIGIVLGTIIYNIISIDFSFSNTYSVRVSNFFESYIYLLVNFLRFYIFILLMSFVKIKEKIYAVLLGIESFKLAGGIVVFVRLHNMLCLSSVIDSLLKIIIVYFFIKNEKPILNKFFAFGIMILGIFAENFLIFFL